MPGASLWLIPPHHSPFTKDIQTLISKTIPARLPAGTKTHDFIPHVTITSQIEASVYRDDPQAWLGSLKLPPTSHHDPLLVSLEALEAGDPFFKKLIMKAEKTTQLLLLAATCRAQGVTSGDSAKADDWARSEYLPHLSLAYAELPASDVQKQINLLVQDCQHAARNLDADPDGIVAKGGSLVLVDTARPIHEWSVVAERHLPHLLWNWPWSKSQFED